MVARDIAARRADTGGRFHIAHMSARQRSTRCARARRAASRHLRGDAAPFPPHRRAAGAPMSYDTNVQDEPAAARAADRDAMLARASPTAASTASPPTTRRTTPTRSTSSSTARPFGIVGLETTVRALPRSAGPPGPHHPVAPRRAALHRPRPHPQPAGGNPEGRQPGGSQPLPPRRRDDHPRQPIPQQIPQHPLRRLDPQRPSGDDDRGWAGGGVAVGQYGAILAEVDCFAVFVSKGDPGWSRSPFSLCSWG